MIKELILKIFKKLLEKAKKDLPEPDYGIGREEIFHVPMSDGVKLTTHVFAPDGAGSFPLIFIRSPYIHDIDVHMCIFEQFIPYGFIVCYQEVRGQGTSEGSFEPFIHERQDAMDTMKWLKEQNWYTGQVGLVGMSYLSYNSLCWADEWGKDVKTAFITVFGNSVYDAFYMNGMLKEEFTVTWCLQNNNHKKFLNEAAFKRFKKAKNIYPKKNVMRKLSGHDFDFFTKVINSPEKQAELWRNINLPDLTKIKVPLCLVTGYYDFSVNGMINMYNNLSPDIAKKSSLTIGPWSHVLMNQGTKKTPGMDLPGVIEAKLMYEWMLHIFHKHPLKDIGIKRYIYNIHDYVLSERMPGTEELTYYFNNNFELVSEMSDIESSNAFIYNPHKPNKTRGGNALGPIMFTKFKRPKQCISEQKLKKKKWNLIYTGGPVKHEKVFTGAEVTLKVSSSAYDTAFYVRLCVVEEGKTYNLSDGITSVIYNDGVKKVYTPNSPVELKIKLNPTAYKLKKENKFLVFICSSDSPSYAVHCNSAEPYPEETNRHTAYQTVYTGKNGSHITLFFEKST